MTERLKNLATSTLAAAVDVVSTTIRVAHPTRFPDGPTFRLRIDDELLIVTAVSGDTLTVTRGAESTTAASHTSGSTVEAVLTAGGLAAYVEENGTVTGLTESRALVSDDAGEVAASAVTAAELGRLSGVTSGLQSQLDAKAASASLATVATTGAYSDLTGKPTLGTAAAQNVGAFAQSANNLSDLASASTARTNLGLGSAATLGAAALLQSANNLSDLASASTARTNLGLGTAAILAAGSANGAATLGSDGKIPTSQLPAAVLGALKYQGTWNASTNVPTIPSAAAENEGHYYRVATAGATSVGGVSDWAVGDWLVSSGAAWQKIDNTEPSLATVATTGAYSDLTGRPTLGTAAAQNVGAFAQSANNLSDLASASTARTNLGLGSAATLGAAAVLQSANNLSDLASESTARTNLGLTALAVLAPPSVDGEYHLVRSGGVLSWASAWQVSITSDGGGATAAVNAAENQTAVTTVAATVSGGTGGTAPTKVFSISGGADAAKFSINASSGALTFASAPDFETPTDANADGVYVVTVRVDAGGASDTQTISVTVTDVSEAAGGPFTANSWSAGEPGVSSHVWSLSVPKTYNLTTADVAITALSTTEHTASDVSCDVDSAGLAAALSGWPLDGASPPTVADGGATWDWTITFDSTLVATDPSRSASDFT